MEQQQLRLSPLQLNRYFVKELRYAVKDDFDGQYDQTAEFPFPQLSAKVRSTRNESDPRAWRFELTVESEDARSKEFPYSLRIVLVGEFAVAESYPAERADLLANVNGPSLLYSAAREALVTVTGRSGFPAIVLPSVLFLPPDEGASKAGEQQVAAEPPPLPTKTQAGAKPRLASKKDAKKSSKEES
jgi:preprotein translocase subunit SecB